MTTVDQEVTGAELRGFMRSWTTGVAVVTSSHLGLPTGCTVNAFTSVSLRPPLVLVSLAETSRTLAVITHRQVFGVNLLTARQTVLAARFASSASDRFVGLDYRTEHGVPLFTEALATMACTVDQTIAAADHVLVLGRPILPILLGGRQEAEPAVFFDGRYRSLSG